MAESVDGSPVHDVHRGLTTVREGLAMVLGSRCWSLPAGEVRDALVEVDAVRGQCEAAYLHLVRAGLATEAGARPGQETTGFLKDRLRLTGARARADVEAARLCDPELGDLAELGQALARGEVSRDHVDVARRALKRVPAELVRTRRKDVSTLLTEHAKEFAPVQAEFLAAELVATVATKDDEDLLDADAHRRRCVSVVKDGLGMHQVHGQLGPDGALVKAVLDHLGAPGQTPDPRGDDDLGATGGTVVLDGVGDTRSPGQRAADALVMMAKLAAAASGLNGTGVGTRAGEPPRVVVHCSPEQLAWVPAAFAKGGGMAPPGLATCEQTGPISPAALQYHACTAVLERVILDKQGKVVEMRSVGRYANRAQRRALAARDGGCAWPGCDIPAQWCDAHHVIWWTRGGTTVIENLVLLCPRHHTEIHAEEWAVTMRDGVPFFTPPAWIDPARQPIRNSYHQRARQTRRAGQQIRLGPDPPDTG